MWKKMIIILLILAVYLIYLSVASKKENDKINRKLARINEENQNFDFIDREI